MCDNSGVSDTDDKHPHLHHAEERYDEVRDNHWNVIWPVVAILIVIAIVWAIAEYA
jgi:hypothetical protein